MAAKIIEDSISPDGIRLVTLQLTYPRFIHSEFMTHRVFSRNASSSRAIPVAKMIEQVRTNYARPIHWGKNQPGMQASEELQEPNLIHVKSLWQQAAYNAADIAEAMMREGVHKQVANRILEPFQFIHVIVSSTEWENFFGLRDHPDAQPEICALAQEIKQAMVDSAPKTVEYGQWHLPYIHPEERNMPINTLKMVSAARCCRVSYLKHDGSEPSVDDDMDLCERLMKSRPIHASPFEHVATPDRRHGHGNFKGWQQFRYELDKESISNPVT